MSKKPDFEQLMTTDLSLSDLAKLTAIRRQSISDRLDDVNLHFKVGAANAKMYNLVDMLTCFLSVGQKDDSDPTTTEEEDRALLIKAQREMAEIKALKMKGEFVSISEISQVVSSEYNQVRSQIITLGESLCRELALESDPEIISDMITTKVNSILSALQADSIHEVENNGRPQE